MKAEIPESLRSIPLVTVSPQCAVSEAQKRIQEQGVSTLAVVGDNGEFRGSLTARMEMEDGSAGNSEINYSLESRLKKAEKRLAESQRLAHIGSWELDHATGQLWWSEETYRIFEIESEVFPASYEAFLELVHPDDIGYVHEAFRHSIEQESPYSITHRLRFRDGRIKYVSERCEHAYDAEGEVIRSIGTVQDVTEITYKEMQVARVANEWTQAMDAFDDPVYVLDAGRRLVRANRAFYTIFSVEPEAVVGKHIARVVHPGLDPESCLVCWAQEQWKDNTLTLEPGHPDNPMGVPAEITIKILHDDLGEVGGMMVAMHDLSHSRKLDERLRLASKVFENTSEGVVVTDVNANIVEVNPAFTEILGYTREEVVGRNPRLFKSGVQDESFYLGMWQSLQNTGRWHGEIWNRHKDGTVLPEWQSISAVMDRVGRVTHYVSVFSDISKIKRSQEQLDFLAHHDALTELPNRLLLNERLIHSIKHAERHGSNLAVIFLDIDRFKHINDSFGHAVGDRLLQQVAVKLLGVMREEDTIARIGGDEFVLLLDSIARPEDASVAAEKVMSIFEGPFQLNGDDFRVTASIGISLYPRDGEDAATLLRNADAAMYRAKDDGKNTYHFYTEELTRNAFERVLLESSLRKAVDNRELRLFYQLQVCLETQTIVGMEALVRWLHPELGVVSPVKFIPLAEETGLIHGIGCWVLKEACRQGKAWLDRGLGFGRVSVNVAGPQIQRGDLVSDVQRVLSETGLPASCLELEVTEGFIMQQTEVAVRQLDELRAIGVTLAIDDFGTGYSSLSYLKQLPVHKLKIDKSFVRDIPQEANDKAIAEAVIALGNSLGLRVIAEGVETEEQAVFLGRAGCHEAQGFLYSRPMPAEDIERMLGEW